MTEPFDVDRSSAAFNLALITRKLGLAMRAPIGLALGSNLIGPNEELDSAELERAECPLVVKMLLGQGAEINTKRGHDVNCSTPLQ
ncbi:hypothetical protein BM1_00665 [Bipolaris maydis]|nr:hypothetical protein BM1_00665 [Bipolaris maydis]